MSTPIAAPVTPVPEEVVVGIFVNDARAAIDFYVRAFGAVEELRLLDPGDNRVGHSELRIGSTLVYVSDEYPDLNVLSPKTIGGSSVQFHLRVENTDTFVEHAVDQGATLIAPPLDRFYGDRTGVVIDPFGYRWSIASEIESVSQHDMQRRWNESAS